MKFTKLSIEGPLLIEPEVFADDRGFFLERYLASLFEENGIASEFVQDNHSFSKKGVLRGLHFQIKPRQQEKLCWAVSGEVYDVIVDIRPQSPTFGKWEGVIISAVNKKMLFVPKGFAHGFVVLSDYADFLYKISDYYAPEAERGVLWNDPDLAIAWPIKKPIISEKDSSLLRFKDLSKL